MRSAVRGGLGGRGDARRRRTAAAPVRLPPALPLLHGLGVQRGHAFVRCFHCVFSQRSRPKPGRLLLPPPPPPPPHAGSVGIGHVRYPTAGTASAQEAQPFFVNSPLGIYLIHNGNLTNTDQLRQLLNSSTSFFNRHLRTDSDSEVGRSRGGGVAAEPVEWQQSWQSGRGRGAARDVAASTLCGEEQHAC